MRFRILLGGAGLTLLTTACGQAPSFTENGQGALSGEIETEPTGDATKDPSFNEESSTTGVVSNRPSSTETSPSGTPTSPNNSGSGPQQGGSTQTQPTIPTPPPSFPSNPSDPNSPVFDVPGLTPEEVTLVGRCITKWGRVPFSGTFTNVRRIKASITVNGIGTAINDQQQTSTPQLTLIDVGVNVFGTPTYNLMNNNGYYCMKVNVNVATSLNINLACRAKLADNSVQVDVGSNTNSTTSAIGVNVGSTVQVQRKDSTGGACQE